MRGYTSAPHVSKMSIIYVGLSYVVVYQTIGIVIAIIVVDEKEKIGQGAKTTAALIYTSQSQGTSKKLRSHLGSPRNISKAHTRLLLERAPQRGARQELGLQAGLKASRHLGSLGSDRLDLLDVP